MNEELLKAVGKGRLIPFVGAGVSLGVTQAAQTKFPNWKQLLDRLEQVLRDRGDEVSIKGANLLRATIDADDLLAAANLALKRLRKSAFTRAVIKAVSVQKHDCSLTLPQAIWGLNPKLVVTTNYDRVLQWAADHDEPKVVLNTSHGEIHRIFDHEERPKIWHLHGHMDTADSLILAPSQYKRLYSTMEGGQPDMAAAAQRLMELFTGHPLLFIGFSMSDAYVLDAIKRGLRTFKGFAYPRWALLKRGDSRTRELWENYEVRTIEFEDYGQPLIEILQQIAHASQQPEIQSTVTVLNSLPPIPPRCREYAREQCADVLPPGVQPDAELSISLQNVYVPAIVENNQPQIRTDEDLPTTTKEPSWQLLFNRLEDESLYVAGAAGYGKSTFAKWLRLQVLAPQSHQFKVPSAKEFQELLPESLRDRLPVLIPFRDIVDDLKSLPRQSAMSAAEFLELLCKWTNTYATKTGITAELLRSWLQAGRTLLILDGVDELPTVAVGPDFQWHPRNIVLDSLPLAVSDWLPRGNRILLTSRPYGLNPDQLKALQAAGLSSCSLQPLPEVLQTLLVERWFSVLPKYSSGASTEAQLMMRAVRGIPRVSELVASPLLLTAVCIVYEQGGELPKDIHDLYNSVVRCSLNARYKNDKVVVHIHRRQLGRIAWGMHTGDPFEPGRANPLASAGFSEIDGILTKYLETNPQTATGQQIVITMRDELLERSGLLLPKNAEKAAFQHLSLQEFLAAEWISELQQGQSITELFCSRGTVANWRETLQFLFCRQAEDRNQSVVTELAGHILCAVEQQTPLLAAELAAVACDAVNVLLDRKYQLPDDHKARLRRLFRQSLDQDAPLLARDQLGLTVGRIGDDRPELDLDNPAAWVTVPAGDYPLGDEKSQVFKLPNAVEVARFPVTNAQFRQFVEDGGYDNPKFWLSGWEEKCAGKWSEPRSYEFPDLAGPTQPVTGVSWYEAQAFCEWFNSRNTGYRYGLPTDNLWEATARGPSGNRYSWGDEWQETWCNNRSSKLQRPSVVGIFPHCQSFCGAIDMTGNVWEWTDTFYRETGYRRELRGGWFFINNPDNLRSAISYYNPPGYRNDYIGFRLSRTK